MKPCCPIALCVPLPPAPARVDSPASSLSPEESASPDASNAATDVDSEYEDQPCCACCACGELCFLPRKVAQKKKMVAASASESADIRAQKRSAAACCQTTSAQCRVQPVALPSSPVPGEAASTHDDAPAALFDPRALFAAALSDEALLARLGEEALPYAMCKGITMARHPSAQEVAEAQAQGQSVGPSIVQAPMTLLPSRLSASLYEKVRALVPHFNLLYERISRDPAFLQRVLRPCADAGDAFLARLLDLHARIEAAHPAYKPQTLALAINRSDYMLHEEEHKSMDATDSFSCSEGHVTAPSPPTSTATAPSLSLKQIEFNTISCGANSLSTAVSSLHRLLVDRYLEPEQAKQLVLPHNDALGSIVAAMAHAHRLFLKQQQHQLRSLAAADLSAAERRVVLLFIVQQHESNLADQKAIEFALWEKHRIPVRRMTLAQVAAEARGDEDTGLLLLRDGKAAEQVASLIYFRAAYTPRDFVATASGEGAGGATAAVSEEALWGALESLHRSVSIKCPSLGYHLSGFKRVQAELGRPGVLERFLRVGVDTGVTADVLRDVRDTFVGMYVPDNAATIARAVANPARFVLKPQREGGGNNLWGANMLAALRQHSHNSDSLPTGDDASVGDALESLRHFVLMEVISAPRSGVMSVATLKRGVVAVEPQAVAELGMLGCAITGEEGDAEEQEEDGTQAEGKRAASPTGVEGGSSDIAGSTSAAAAAAHTTGSRPIVFYRNEYGGYLLRTKSSALNEGGLMSGAGAIDSLVLV